MRNKKIEILNFLNYKRNETILSTCKAFVIVSVVLNIFTSPEPVVTITVSMLEYFETIILQLSHNVFCYNRFLLQLYEFKRSARVTIMFHSIRLQI